MDIAGFSPISMPEIAGYALEKHRKTEESQVADTFANPDPSIKFDSFASFSIPNCPICLLID